MHPIIPIISSINVLAPYIVWCPREAARIALVIIIIIIIIIMIIL